MKNSVLKLSLLIVYCSILGNKLLAQNPVGSNPSATSTSSIPNIMSPEAAGLGKYGTYDVNLYTGSPNISLPLHEINENGVKIPITLSYDASGFIPNKNAGIVGLNWNLFAGGAITRVVNGVPDEMLNDPNSVSATGEQNGYIFGQVEKQLGSYTSNDFLTTSFLKPSNCFRMPGAANCATPTVQYNEPGYNFTWVANYELEPDVFSFNFLGHSGKFFLGNDGNVKVSGDRKYKVDLSKISLKDPNGDYTNDWRLLLGSITDPNFLNSAPLSQITITADDGYEFTFGGAFKNIEVQFNYISAVDRGIEPTFGVINAWNLTRVKTPEGKLIFFNNYEYNIDDAKVIYRLFEIQTGFFDNIPVNFLEVKIFENEHKQEYSNVWRNNSQPYVARISKSLIKHCYLKEIVTALQTVTFNYEAKDLVNKFFPNNEAVGSTAYTNNTDKYCTNKLNSIEINDNINNSGAFDLYQPYPTYKKITFNYSNKPGNRSNRLFLDGLNINGTGSSATGLNYSFAYTKTTPADLPDPITKGIDIWGYYNGNDNNITLVGGLNTINTSNYEINISDPGNDRRVNSANPGIALNGILKSITYPTGGKTEFTFENHDCGQILKRTIAGTNLPAPEWETPINNLTVGGLRIKEIKNTPGTTTTYKYVLDYENNQSSTSSSGLLTKSEAFVKYYLDIWASYKDVFSNNIANATTYGESHIGYKEVIEINGEGFTKYEFSNQQSNPDTYVLNDPSGGPAYKLTPEHTTTDYNKQMLRLFKYSSREDERGKITKKSFFKNLATIPIKSIEYVYNNDINRLNECAYGMYFPDFLYSRNQDSDPDKTLLWVFIGLIHPYALYYYHNLPSQMIEKDYGTNSSTPLVTTTKYLYRSNIDPRLYSKSVTQSDGSEIEHRYYYPDHFSDPVYLDMVAKNIISPVVKEEIYKYPNGNPTKLLTVNKHNYQSFSTTLANSIFRVATEKTENVQVSKGNEQDIITYDAYSDNGMVVDAHKPNDQPLSYIWDYKGLYPVAQVSNATSNSIAYTSFEADGNGGWDFEKNKVFTVFATPTGKKCYKISTRPLSLLNTMPHNIIYSLSYWSKNGQYTVSGTSVTVKQGATINGWTYFEHEISNPNSGGNGKLKISGAGFIDEVRFYPKYAQMTTYTYEPLAGITSKCDINNRITSYEYDDLGRLTLARDQDKKVLKKWCYNFAGQSENCLTDNNPVYQETGLTRCKPCDQDPVYQTGIFQKQVIDVNPQTSGTYNQLTWMDVTTNTTSCIASPPDWEATNTIRCQTTNHSNTNYTGYQERLETNKNPCSLPVSRWVIIGYNPSACPLPPCNPATCVGPGIKCVNGICENGTQVCISGRKEKIQVYINGKPEWVWKWVCTYYYCFSDGTTTDTFEIIYDLDPNEPNTTVCPLNMPCGVN